MTETEQSSYFSNELAHLTFLRTYARWNPEINRRETYPETVLRVVNFFRKVVGDKLDEQDFLDIHHAILHMRVMPSMRLLALAGPAVEASNVASFNCAYTPIDSIQSLCDIFFVLLNGCGAGYSVERRYTEMLPTVAYPKSGPVPVHVVGDSAEDWCRALRAGLDAWFAGDDIAFDYSLVRPAGTPLITKGGRASGPGPLDKLLMFCRAKTRGAAGRKLRPIELSDMSNSIAEGVVVGGVRRSSQISLSDLDDEEMMNAKRGEFYREFPYRSMSNNSGVYETKPDYATFSKEFDALISSGTGERGIFSRYTANRTKPTRRQESDFGSNPCCEIILKGRQFCNLSSVVARPEDTKESLLEKVRIASIIGTIQSTLTSFNYLDNRWKENCDEERLLGISVTGQLSCPAFYQHPETMESMREQAVRVNQEYSQRLGVNASVATTCVKPEGTCSIVTGTSSGLHPWYAQWYIRRIRVSASDPLCQLMLDSGIPNNPEVGQERGNATTFVFDFPVKAPEGAITRHMVSALEQLEYWKRVKVHYVEHNPSATIYVKPEEWLLVKDWVFSNFDVIGGLSFLPSSDHVYELAPYTDLTESEYNRLVGEFPSVDWTLISDYELEDRTTSASEVACSGGACEVE